MRAPLVGILVVAGLALVAWIGLGPGLRPAFTAMPRTPDIQEAETALVAWLKTPPTGRAALRPRMEAAERALDGRDPGSGEAFLARVYQVFLGEELGRPGAVRVEDLDPGERLMYRFLLRNPSRPAGEFLRARREARSPSDLSEVDKQIIGGGFDMDRRAANEAFLAMVGPLEGRVAADLGGGLGLLAWQMAEAVGPRGRVYLADVDPDLEAFWRFTAAVEPWRALAPRVRFHRAPSPADPGLPEALDALTMQDVHALCDASYEAVGRALLARLHGTLKPGGRLGLFESFRPDISPERARERLERAGFRVREVRRILQGQGFVLAATRTP